MSGVRGWVSTANSDDRGQVYFRAGAVVSFLSSYHRSSILQVMDTMIESHSQWGLDNARPRAESFGMRAKPGPITLRVSGPSGLRRLTRL